MGHFDIEAHDTALLVTLEQRDHFSEGLPSYYQHIITLYERLHLLDKDRRAGAHSYVVDFANLALQALPRIPNLTINAESKLRNDLLSRLFSASIATENLEQAYTTLSRYSNPVLRASALNTFVKTTIAKHQTPYLLSLPFTTLAQDVDGILAGLASKAPTTQEAARCARLLYAYRIRRNDFRGAATAVYELLQRLLARSSAGDGDGDGDEGGEEVLRCYLTLTNLLASVGEEERWILAETPLAAATTAGAGAGVGVGLGRKAKRRVVTLEDVRRGYQEELDRRQVLERGGFSFVGAVGGGEDEAMVGG